MNKQADCWLYHRFPWQPNELKNKIPRKWFKVGVSSPQSTLGAGEVRHPVHVNSASIYSQLNQKLTHLSRWSTGGELSSRFDSFKQVEMCWDNPQLSLADGRLGFKNDPPGWKLQSDSDIHRTFFTGWFSAIHLEVVTTQRLPAWISGSHGGASILLHPPMRLDDADHPLGLQSGIISSGDPGQSHPQHEQHQRCRLQRVSIHLFHHARGFLTAVVLRPSRIDRVSQRLETSGDIIRSLPPSR